MEVQVETSHYVFSNYVNQDRWNSYYQQIFEASKCKGKNILYIGTGDGIVVDVLRKIGKNVKTLDFDKALKPDYVGSVTKIKEILAKDWKKFDVILRCQVLEHLPFSEFEKSVKQDAECAKQRLIISLPNNNRKYRIFMHLPRPIGKHKGTLLIRRHFTKKWDINNQGNGEHYWEIDAKGCPKRKDIAKILKKYAKKLKFYTLFENPYHIFFILDK